MDELDQENGRAESASHANNVRNQRHASDSQAGRSFTMRAILTGISIGAVVCLSNIYFGLQTGYYALMSLPSSLLGFVVFKLNTNRLRYPFSPAENVLVQTIAGAAGSMPATTGLLNIIPALEYIVGQEKNGPVQLESPRLLIWGLGVCFFGLVWAMILRPQVVIRERLPFPGAKATASLIRVLHNMDNESQDSNNINEISDRPRIGKAGIEWKDRVILLLVAAGCSGVLTIIMYFVPLLRRIPIFGPSAAKNWLWTLSLSPGFIGQGIITGPAIPLHMFAGSIVGWGILSPIAKNAGWAPGDVDNWDSGSRAWILWISLATLMTDCLVHLFWQIVKLLSVSRLIPAFHTSSRNANGLRYAALNGASPDDISQETAQGHVDLRQRFAERQNQTAGSHSPPRERSGDWDSYFHILRIRRLGVFLIVSMAFGTITTKIVFNGFMTLCSIIIAIILSLPLSVMGIRALAETDYNPMSGIGKISQLIFAMMIPPTDPNAMLINLVAGGLAQSGGTQGADITHDLKVGQLIGASPTAQFHGMLIGSIAGVFMSCAFYKLYTSIYPVPGELFQIPSAHIWVLAAKLVTERDLPEKTQEFSLCFAALFAFSSITRIRYAGHGWRDMIPSGVAFAVGIYNIPSFTLARVIGGLMYWYYCFRLKGDKNRIVVFASGLVLGEGLASILNLGLEAANVPQFT